MNMASRMVEERRDEAGQSVKQTFTVETESERTILAREVGDVLALHSPAFFIHVADTTDEKADAVAEVLADHLLLMRGFDPAEERQAMSGVYLDALNVGKLLGDVASQLERIKTASEEQDDPADVGGGGRILRHGGWKEAGNGLLKRRVVLVEWSNSPTKWSTHVQTEDENGVRTLHDGRYFFETDGDEARMDYVDRKALLA